MSKMAVVIPAAHSPEMTNKVLELAKENATGETHVGVWDNGVGGGRWGTGENIGNYEVFNQIRDLGYEFVLVIHNDCWIWERGYDERLMAAFAADPKLGLCGFVGSDVIDWGAGRGFHAWTNFAGRNGSPAEDHGIRVVGFKAAANLDGVALMFRMSALEQIPVRDDFPPHHAYDRLFCLDMLEHGFHVGYLGIECDHQSGQTANVYQGYHDLAREWILAHGKVRGHEGDYLEDVCWDNQVYLEAMARLEEEFRDEKRFYPLKVGQDHMIYHIHPLRGL